MKAVIQRVAQAQVTVADDLRGEISHGFVILLGVGHGDEQKDVDYLVQKIVNLRVFEDSEGKLNLSLLDVQGAVLAISQFTLYADCKKGRRPSFVNAAPPEKANLLYESFVHALRQAGVKTETGEFQAHMLVEIHNDGPVTIILDTKDT